MRHGLPLVLLVLASLAPSVAAARPVQAHGEPVPGGNGDDGALKGRMVLAQTAQPVRPPRPLAVQAPSARRVPPLPKPAPGREAARPLPVLPAVPLPLPRPKDMDAAAAKKDETPAEPPAEAPPAMDDAALAACLSDFAADGGIVIPGPAPEPPAAQAAACTIPGPVTFAQVKLPDGRPVRLESAITVRCTLARELAAWIRDDLAPIAARAGGELAQLSGVGGYACRPRNGQAGAQISEHASGNALDILALTFTDGRVIDLWKDAAETREIRAAVRESVCRRFFTVLGPGSDAAHANHLHIDLRARRNGYRMCQWDVK